ncbi:hypothetical protein LCGC14_1585130 [marine sediment metagenome]|uniref:Uncharacterized protein n=1 Tax=marine sediment metagenome TaxID=412755 RepID=A0A0F9IFP6_9ZZZZ
MGNLKIVERDLQKYVGITTLEGARVKIYENDDFKVS